MKGYRNILIATILLMPVMVSAQLTGVKGLIEAVGGLINPLIRTLVGAALLVFFWGLAKFIFRVGGDEKAVEEGKRIMKWGLVALFVMLSVWGIIGFVQRELGLPSTIAPPSPSPSPAPFPGIPI